MITWEGGEEYRNTGIQGAAYAGGDLLLIQVYKRKKRRYCCEIRRIQYAR